MVATVQMKVCTGTNAGTESPAGDASNWNLMSTDAYDSTGTGYQTSRITVPPTGTSYSYERWLRLQFSGTFNLIENIKVWHSAGTLSDAALDLLAGVSILGVTPTNAASSIATTVLTSWDVEGEALDITPSGGITSAGGTKYLVAQLKVPSTVVTPGDIGTHTITFSYEES